ncbi:class I SAM-dependent methyltransferase [Methanoplanus limicola]|uniref:Methyltransferase type 11 n=1 Tax=Methanoplanus limicola DSM 2279 TaxID=937775 RepID=H1YXB5_9EURY|nr:class I SAM-dependent methyltransferase [Methanoplanus limicola]EHQ36852.1 Methyltransferase type 11 [Methanoplanus limicola DSM 2279]
MECILCKNKDLSIISQRLRGGPGIVYYCDKCKIGILKERKDDSKLFYDEEYRKRFGPDIETTSNYDDIFNSYVNYQENRLKLLKPLINSNMRLLEVGCSTGHFIYNIKPFLKDVIGVDYDSRAAEFASKVCNCKTYGCDLKDSGLEKKSFDIVCALQTLEHVDEPIEFLKLLKSYIKPKGKIVIEVPNLLDPLLSLFNNEQYHNFYFHEAHTFYFTPDSFMQVMRAAGYNGDILFFQDYNFLNHLNWILLGKPQKSCHMGLSEPKFPIVDTVDSSIKDELNLLISNFDKDYKNILAKYGVTDNMMFIGEPI